MGLISRKAGIEHIDTNIIVRLIVGDDPKNYQKAKKLISRKDKTFVFEDALNLYTKRPKLSFVDCYLAAVTNLSQEKPLWTLDKKLATQVPVAQLL